MLRIMILLGYVWHLAFPLPSEGKITPSKINEELDTFYNQNIDYRVTGARVTDRDDTGHILKMQAEDPNVKFLRSGDHIFLQVARFTERERCEAYVRGSEKDYFAIYVKDFAPCWPFPEHIRRGTQMTIFSEVLEQRVKEASVYRLQLLKRREDYFKQLSMINNFIWTFEEQRVAALADYDHKILLLQQERESALDRLLARKRDGMRMQEELSYKLDLLDKDLEHYRVEKRELWSDRWFLDHDTGLPMQKRPQNPKRASKTAFEGVNQ